MYKDVLRSIQDIGLFPVISFVLFFLFFIIMILWVMMYKKDKIKKMENLPFDEGQSKKEKQNHETSNEK